VLTLQHENSPAGALNSAFNPGNDPFTPIPYNALPGANGPVNAIAMQPDGKSIIAGEFTAYNQSGVNFKPNINRVARINTDGQIDNSFDPGDGADAFVSAVALDRVGNIILGGAFTSFNRDLRYGINGIVRLKSNGSIDTNFFAGQGANGIIRTIAIATNQNILICGEFTSFNGTNRNYVARLNPDGSLDSTFDTSAASSLPASLPMSAGSSGTTSRGSTLMARLIFLSTLATAWTAPSMPPLCNAMAASCSPAISTPLRTSASGASSVTMPTAPATRPSLPALAPMTRSIT
jgi:hypothetical protein